MLYIHCKRIWWLWMMNNKSSLRCGKWYHIHARAVNNTHYGRVLMPIHNTWMEVECLLHYLQPLCVPGLCYIRTNPNKATCINHWQDPWGLGCSANAHTLDANFTSVVVKMLSKIYIYGYMLWEGGFSHIWRFSSVSILFAPYCLVNLKQF